jgi:hypothetical protein
MATRWTAQDNVVSSDYETLVDGVSVLGRDLLVPLVQPKTSVDVFVCPVSDR